MPDVAPRTFDDFFREATGNPMPFDYQRRLAVGEGGTGMPCVSRLIDVPTGCGKTAAVVLSWLWNRVVYPDTDHRNKWPRRLVYCLPMRTLVEQTRDEVRRWLENTNRFWNGKPPHLDKVGVHILMGGEEARDWDVCPEENAILIGTQDMLLSRALNRGYGMSRYRWPMHFGLLNNDCLWVMDETQLMGPGLSTACQLEAFRSFDASGYSSFGVAGSVTWYMSATSNLEHLRTREWRKVVRPAHFKFGLTPAEKEASTGPIYQRRCASKQLELKPMTSFQDLAPSKLFLAELLKRHGEMVTTIAGNPLLPARTLVICNTVDRAIIVHKLLAAEKTDGCDLLLLHSRFRPPEREEQMKRLNAASLATFPKGQIVVSTQVIEAGVDVSSGILCSEIAPLSSLVQRLGRLNRAGEFQNSAWEPVAIMVGLGVEPAPLRETKDETKKREERNARRCLPYELPTCESAWESLRKLGGDASPAQMEQIQNEIAASIPRCPYSLQRHELTDFFDTDANLSLGYTDVSPFVRGLDEDTDLQVLWRESWLQENGEEGTGKPGFTPDFQRDEICPVPMGKAKNARDILNRGWIWRGKESGWLSVRDAGIAPGMTILVPRESGGYDVAVGWTGDNTDNKHQTHYQPRQVPSDEEQLSSLSNGWQSIAVHTAVVMVELRELLRLTLAEAENETQCGALLSAVPWHDVGKNHKRWRWAALRALLKARVPKGKIRPHLPLAKFSLSDSPLLRNVTGRDLKREIAKLNRSFRPGIAHEVASALAFRQAEQKRLGRTRDTNLASLLAEYVIMSHHGRVRKVLRDEVPKFPKDRADTNAVRGVEDGSMVPPVEIESDILGCDSLSTDCRRMGRDLNGNESYTRSVLRLLDYYGPFKLAFFEAVFRAADIRASIIASRDHHA